MTYVLEKTVEGTDLVVTGDWSSAVESCLVEGRADGLVLNYARGFRTQDLTFLENWPVLRLQILARTIDDLSPIYALAPSLVSLRVQSSPRSIIELDRLPRLTSLAASWEQVRASIDSASWIERLFLLSYSEPDLRPLTLLSGLTSLIMKDYPHIVRLDGLEEFPRLTELSLHVAKRLEDITGVEHAASHVLTRLQLTSCRQLTDIKPVAACTSLSFFNASEGGAVASVGPLAGLTNLASLHMYGSTRITDGDLDPIARLPRLRDFRMQSRRSYSPSVEDIKGMIVRNESL